MPLLAANPVSLSNSERQGLEKLVGSHQTGQQLSLRARIILHADEKVEVKKSARRLDIRGKTVRRWRKRWCEGHGKDIQDRLSDRQRSGKPCKFTPEQVCKIIALACETPEKGDGLPITHWSRRELAEEAVRRKIVTEISQTSAGRFLKRC